MFLIPALHRGLGLTDMDNGRPIEKRVAVNGIEIVYFEWGAERQGDDATILLVHATGFHARCWDQTIAHVALHRGRIVGMVNGTPKELKRMFVRPGYHGKGIAISTHPGRP